MVVLPLDQATPVQPRFRVGTTLAGVPYVLDLRWNGRAGRWLMDIRDAEANPIRVGVAVVLGALLGRLSVDPRFPRGVLFAADLSGEQREAGLDDLGTRVVVYFATFDEYAAMTGGAA